MLRTTRHLARSSSDTFALCAPRLINMSVARMPIIAGPILRVVNGTRIRSKGIIQHKPSRSSCHPNQGSMVQAERKPSRPSSSALTKDLYSSLENYNTCAASRVGVGLESSFLRFGPEGGGVRVDHAFVFLTSSRWSCSCGCVLGRGNYGRCDPLSCNESTVLHGGSFPCLPR